MSPTLNPGAYELTAEIHRLEAHLRHLHTGEESAYEKALIRTYEQLLDNQRARLAGQGTA